MSADVPLLLDLPLDDLPAEAGRGYRRDQLARWLYARGAGDVDAMTDLPRSWRAELAAGWRVDPFDGFERFASSDGSVRYLFTLPDGRRTEAVYMPYARRTTVCISSMVGCPAGCTFCATGALGFGRNLTRGEIVGQLLAVARAEGVEPTAIRNVVLMGMGEALLNYDAAVSAIRTLIDPRGLDLSPRRITLSTVGLPRRIERLAGEGLPLTLAVSLHAPDDATRRTIIPTAHAHDVDDVMASLHAWYAATKRRVSVEYTMLRGVNDAPWQADALADRLEGLLSHVNLIPFNVWDGSPQAGSDRATIQAFRTRLEAAGVSVSVRFSRGQDSGAACGQLSWQQRGTAAPDAPPNAVPNASVG